jgi:hypothetical protein
MHRVIAQIEYEADRPDVAFRVDPVDVVACGLRLWWRRVVSEVKLAWHEAHKATYGVCEHPPSMVRKLPEKLSGDYESTWQCGCCGMYAEPYSVGGFYKLGADGQKIYER